MTNTSDALAREAQQRRAAEAVLADLDLIRRWDCYGRSALVGAFAYGLLADPDIDLEIYCPDLRIEHGFQVLGECALNDKVAGVRFTNELGGPDKALYWQIRYKAEDGLEWKIDMWSAPADYALPRSEDLVEPMRASLTPETRYTILELKELRREDPSLRCASVDLYRAVLDDGVRTPDELRTWLGANETGKLTDWKPRKLS